MRAIILKSESFFRSFSTQVLFLFESNDIFRISEQSYIECTGESLEKRKKVFDPFLSLRGSTGISRKFFFSFNRIVIASEDRTLDTDHSHMTKVHYQL